MIVYKSTNKVDGKSYIGKTVKTLEQRKGQHLAESKVHRKNYHFYNAIQKYGWDSFEWIVLYEGESEEDITIKEVYFIELYDTYSNGYNSTKGGEGVIGSRHSDEWKNHMRTNNPMFNEESRRKMGESKTGGIIGVWADRDNQDRYDEIRKQFSDRMCENNPMFDPETVKKVNKTKEKYFKSDKYKNDRERLNDVLIGKLAKEWLIITPEGEEIVIKNLNGFCKEHGLSSSCMCLVADGKRKQHKKYKCLRRG